jgi:hypothetical protein
VFNCRTGINTSVPPVRVPCGSPALAQKGCFTLSNGVDGALGKVTGQKVEHLRRRAGDGAAGRVRFLGKQRVGIA